MFTTQVANYGLGGHFAAHFDALLKDLPVGSPVHMVGNWR